MRNTGKNDIISDMQFPKLVSDISKRQAVPGSRPGCLTDSDISIYISKHKSGEEFAEAEAHLLKCAACRQNLADVVYMLDPETDGEMAETHDLSKIELTRAIAKVAELSQKAHSKARFTNRWGRWPLAAAAIIGFAVFGFWSSIHIYESYKSRAFLSQANVYLAQNLGDASHSSLRLSLQFDKQSVERSHRGEGSLRAAENLFYQALAVRENILDAHLGLAYINLSESRFADARAEFEKALNIDDNNIHALIGHGISQFEEATQSKDPVRRNSLLLEATKDFDAALRLDPGSLESRYNKIWTLFESGLHQKALQEIGLYLSRDSGSVWAERLRGLKIKILASRSGAVEDEVNRAAQNRDSAALGVLARQVPHQMPAAIWAAMRRSLELSPSSTEGNGLSSKDLSWAAETMEAAYSSFSGDHSFKAFLTFCNGLSPPQREQKRRLDKEFQKLVRYHQVGNFAAVLDRSKLLESKYTFLKDYWQLINLHHLRGNSHYLGRADFGSAEAEFRKMLDLSDRINAPDLTAKALGSLAVIYVMEGKVTEGLDSAYRLRNLAMAYKLESWQVTSGVAIGNQLYRAGQFAQSVDEYTAALKIAYRLFDATKIIEILEHLGLVLDRWGRIEDARLLYRQALDSQDNFLKGREIYPTPATANRRLNLLSKQGELYLRSGDYVSAESNFRESIKSTPAGMSELAARNYIGLAATYLQMHRLPEAKAMMASAKALNASHRYPDIEWQQKLLEGKLSKQSGNNLQAVDSLQQAVEILEQMRRRVKSEDLRQSFLMDRYEPFRLLITLLFEASAETHKIIEFVDRAKSMTLKEHLNLQESGSLYSNIENSTPTTILEYFFVNKGLLIFVTRKEHTDVVYRSFPREDCSGNIGDYLDSIRKNDLVRFSRSARRLYDNLIAPAEGHIFSGPAETLVILPDGPLHLLPFAGLQDPQGRFLIEKTPIAFSPSRSVFRHCMLSGRHSLPGQERVMLIDGTATLPSARKELDHIAKLYGRNVSFLESGNEPKMRKTVEESEIVHFSGHSDIVNGAPVLLLRTYPNAIHLDCQQINSWNMSRTYIVNLAGCSTGIGPLSEGEAPWGLIPAFMNAGAPAILASLMPLDDESTRILNSRFYDLLRKGCSKAEALQLAQTALINIYRQSPQGKPQLWIPYVLIGNPQ